MWPELPGEIVTIDEHGNVTESGKSLYEAAYISLEYDDIPAGWEFATYGMTRQYGYDGPWLHVSEFVTPSQFEPGTYAMVYRESEEEYIGHAIIRKIDE